VRAIRPAYVGIDPVDRVVYQPGEIAQCDLWFPAPPIPVAGGQGRVVQERVLPVLVMTLGFCRFLAATMIPSRQAGDILAGMWTLISQIGRVTKTLVWDRESRSAGPGGSARRRPRSLGPQLIPMGRPGSGWLRRGTRSSRAWSSAASAVIPVAPDAHTTSCRTTSKVPLHQVAVGPQQAQFLLVARHFVYSDTGMPTSS
jgi:hypothetical protein